MPTSERYTKKHFEADALKLRREMLAQKNARRQTAGVLLMRACAFDVMILHGSDGYINLRFVRVKFITANTRMVFHVAWRGGGFVPSSDLSALRCASRAAMERVDELLGAIHASL